MDINDKDQSILSFINPRDSRDRITVFFERGYFSKMLAKFFDELWKKAEILK